MARMTTSPREAVGPRVEEEAAEEEASARSADWSSEIGTLSDSDRALDSNAQQSTLDLVLSESNMQEFCLTQNHLTSFPSQTYIFFAKCSQKHFLLTLFYDTTERAFVTHCRNRFREKRWRIYETLTLALEILSDLGRYMKERRKNKT